MTRTRHTALATLCALAAACGQARPVDEGRPHCDTWKERIGPMVAASCARCHGGATPAGSYALDSYLGALGSGSDAVPNAVAGDAASRLLTALDPAAASEPHKGQASVRAALETWVVACGLAYAPPGVHAPGILDRASPDFHGALVRDRQYDFSLCRKCHGDDDKGGKSGVSCLTCHKDGVTACTTCHGNPPSTGAHRLHATQELTTAIDCSACHVVPATWDAPGHLFRTDGGGARVLDPAPAEVSFGPLAQSSVMPDNRQGPALWDRETRTCRNVYCHGATYDDKNARASAPSWDGQAKKDCDTCHGNAPSSHGGALRCVDCHPLVADGARRVVDRARHIDARISLGDESGQCWACHGEKGAPAPPRPLAGNLADPSPVVGAHAVHLAPRLGLRGPVACSDCHLVPATLRAAGHIDDDGPAEVFPKAPGFVSLAQADGAQPAWDRKGGTCANVYCHGGGARLARDLAPGGRRTPSWTGGVADAQCGACHGLPPDTVIDGKGTRHPQQGRCAQCHPNTVDESGLIIVSGPPGMETSRHMNGIVDTP